MQEIKRPALLDGSFHQHLLRDTARLDGFADAIARTVKPGDVVADIGSGSGILAYLAVQAGAERAFAVEMNTNSFAALLRHVRVNGMTGRVVPVLADGTQWRPKEPVDVVVCELMETGLLHEPIAAVVRNVRSWESRPRAFLPKEVRLLAEGVEVQDTFRGYRATYPGFRTVEGDEPLTTLAEYARFDFERDEPPERVEARFEVLATRDGRLGGLQLRTDTTVAPGVELRDSPGYCSPVVLTLDEPRPIRKGERLVGVLSYDFDYTSEPLRFELHPA